MPFGNLDQNIRQRLQEAIAAERTAEIQLRSLASEVDDPDARGHLAAHADLTRAQGQRLASRLLEMGDRPQPAASPNAHLLAARPALAPGDQTPLLVLAYAAGNAEIALYEALAVAAMAAGDSLTEQLARQIQEEEREAADRLWRLLGKSARRAVEAAPLAA